MKIKISLLFLSIFYTSLIFSQVTKTLDECIQIACDRSLQAFVSEYQYNTDISNHAIYKASRLPSVSLKAMPLEYNRSIIKRYDYENNLDIYRSQQISQSSGSISLSQDVGFTGGTIFIDSELGYIKNRGYSEYNQFSSIPFRIGYSQKLFGYNRLKWESKIESLKFEKAKKNFLFRREEITENIVLSFFTLAIAQKEYELVLENILTTDSLYNIALEHSKISSISRADLLTLELDKIEYDRKLEQDRLNLEQAQRSLADLLNVDNYLINLIIPEPKNQVIIVVKDVILMTQKYNPNYSLFKQKLLEAKRDVDIAKKQLFFDASISASIGFNQVATTFSEAYKKPLQQDLISISLTIPILDWGTRRAKLSIAKNDLNIVELTNQIEDKNINQEIKSIVDNFENQQNSLKSAFKTIDVAKEAYKINKQRFLLGKVDINTLNYSLNRYNDAQINYLENLKLYWLSFYKIRKLSLYDFVNKIPLSI